MQKPEWLKVLLQKRMLLVLALGFVSGLPLGLSGTALQAWYAIDGVDVVTIGFLALVGQPYVYKFIWAPFMDKWRVPYLGRRRGWMLITQISLIVVLCLMALSSPQAAPYQLAFLALCLAFLSATQDIAIDAYRTELLTPEERGMGTAMAVSGYRIAMLVSGGLTLIVADYAGFSFTYFLMAALMGIGVFATFWAKEPQQYREPPPTFAAACIEPFKEFLSRRHAIALLAFVVLYKLGDAFASTLTTAFLLKGVGFTLKDVGIINKTGGLVSTLFGVFVGGVLMVRIGLFRSLLGFGIIQALTNILFFVLALMGPNYGMLILTVCLENFGGGLGTAAFMALVMSLCNPRFTATQFALISALAAVGRVFVGPAAGILVENVGWAEFFLWTVLFAIPGLILLIWLRPTINEYEARQEEAMQSGIEEAKASA
ncbi:MAG: muropeptide transporter AmpG [Gammaproteobacteria bacterium 39-13]|nr:MFS transporter [Gammaproteobacteria bacterium]OJV88493.1 MAG: muropeptide transporter AmpG [Gammaproteobacteria bacterium 39-13]